MSKALLEVSPRETPPETPEEELLDICDEAGNAVGVASRASCHATGLLHRVVHGWVLSRRADETWIYFQQRAFSKKDFPGKYDIAVGGHIGAGEDVLGAMVREMREELGIDAPPEAFRYLGSVREELRVGDFFDREIGLVYLYEHPDPVFNPGEEVAQVVRISAEELSRKELYGARRTAAFTMDGRGIELLPEDWCLHEGEFESLILPFLWERA